MEGRRTGGPGDLGRLETLAAGDQKVLDLQESDISDECMHRDGRWRRTSSPWEQERNDKQQILGVGKIKSAYLCQRPEATLGGDGAVVHEDCKEP